LQQSVYTTFQLLTFTCWCRRVQQLTAIMSCGHRPIVGRFLPAAVFIQIHLLYNEKWLFTRILRTFYSCTFAAKWFLFLLVLLHSAFSTSSSGIKRALLQPCFTPETQNMYSRTSLRTFKHGKCGDCHWRRWCM